MRADLERVAGLAPEERFAVAPPFLAPDLLRVHLRPVAFLWEAATWIKGASGEAAVAFAGATGAITEAAPKARTVTAVAKVFLSNPELLIDPRGIGKIWL